MGPNGSGKSTLAQVLAGHPAYKVTGGEVLYEGEDLLDMEPEERAQAGVFLAFQYPVEIPGRHQRLLPARGVQRDPEGQGARGSRSDGLPRPARGEAQGGRVGSGDHAARSVNAGFSGGEKKRNEILQMAVLEPRLAILDETDSGLDIDALRIVADGVNALKRPDNATIVVTHYQRLLNYIVPDFVHVLVGRPDREVGRQGTGAGARGARLRVDRGPAGTGATRMTAVADRIDTTWCRRGSLALRQQGGQRFAELGFPTSRDEEWRFTPICADRVGDLRPGAATAPRFRCEALAPFMFGHAEWPRLVFVNGRYSAELSSVALEAGVMGREPGAGAGPRSRARERTSAGMLRSTRRRSWR